MSNNKLTYSQAGKLGAEKGYKKIKELEENRIKEYNKNPNLCNNCEKPLDYSKKDNKFCSKSCSVSYNNLGRKRNYKTGKNAKKNCLNCGKETTNQKYCSNKCQQEFNYKIFINKWLNGDIDGCMVDGEPSNYIKKYLIETYGHKCMKCGNKNWLNQKIPLELEHKDGKANNNDINNLELLCPNCHSLTPYYGSKNSGRSTRKKRKVIH